MNSAAQDTVKEAASTVDTKIIPVMRQAITTVQMILFQHLKKASFSDIPTFRKKKKFDWPDLLSTTSMEVMLLIPKSISLPAIIASLLKKSYVI
ncbi:MAG: hypothetical protein D3918_00800 [Candidatus Electrothrix sp. AX2]|nr:hypothetical protein [Candidatus Electrothrix gigas]